MTGIRAQQQAEALGESQLARLITDGPDGLDPDAWQALVAEQGRRNALRQVEERAPTNRWGSIGFRRGVELGMAIAVGFSIVGFIVGIVYGLLLLAR